MTAFTEKLDRAAAAATCDVLKIGGGTLLSAGIWGIGAGGAGFGSMGLGAAALLAANYVCDDPWDPNQIPPGGPGNTFGCIEKEPGTSNAVIWSPCPIAADDPDYKTYCSIKASGVSAINSVVQTQYSIDPPLWDYVVTVTLTDGSIEVIEPLRFDKITSFSLLGPGECVTNEGPDPGFPEIPPYEFVDEDGCTLNVTFQGFAGSPENVGPVYKIEGNGGTSNLRADGGELPPVGDCNFYPTLYYGKPGGGDPYIGPWNPDWDGPEKPPFPWGPDLDGLVGGFVGALLDEALAPLLATPEPPSNWQMTSVCEVDAQGNPQTDIIEAEIPPLIGFDSVNKRIDSLIPFLQVLKNWKQPICPPAKAEGDLRTISFRSVEVSPNGKSCLRKRLRYRSISGIGLDGLIDHWKDFTFQAGPVLVRTVGSTLGTIKCWADSVDEGKRVLLHAFAEAGVDANQAGRWEVSGSTSTRLGMPGTMKVDTTGGYYWITDRDGSSQRPIVGKT